MAVNLFTLLGDMFNSLFGNPVLTGIFFLVLILIIGVRLRIGFDGLLVTFMFGLFIIMSFTAAFTFLWALVLVGCAIIMAVAFLRLIRR